MSRSPAQVRLTAEEEGILRGWTRQGTAEQPSAEHLPIPAPIRIGPTQVGAPIYPESNIQQKSYQNVVENPTQSETVLLNASFLMLPRFRLILVSRQGEDFLRSWDYVVVVDVSHGIANPVIQRIDIPKNQLKKPGENPQFVKVMGIEAVPPDTVRLSVPQAEYGVNSVVVHVP